MLFGYLIFHVYSLCHLTRGGVEDTRLEAKAKDTKKSEAKGKDSPSEDRHSRDQGQECSRPRPRTKDTSASVLKKKGLPKNCSGNHQKKTFSKKFSGAPQTFNNSENSAVLEPRTGQFSKDLRLRGQGLDLRGQGLQNQLHLCISQYRQIDRQN